MEKVYQVFVSSTYEDLQNERRQVSDTLAKAGFIPAGMELFPATDRQQLEFIQKTIDRSDYYVIIVGGRYGSLADGKLSYTEKEYEYAVEKGLPVLAFLHKHPDKIELGKSEQDPAQRTRLTAFKDRLTTSRIVAFWTDAPDLCTKVLTAVMQATNLSPSVGWIRGDEAIDPKVLLETERLRIENADLKRRLDALNTQEVTFPSNLPGPKYELKFTLHIKRYTTTDPQGRKPPEIMDTKAQIGRIFIDIFDALLGQPSEYQLRSIIARSLYHLPLPDDRTKVELSIPADEVKALRYHFEALSLITAIGAVETTDLGGLTFPQKYIAWTTTDRGRRYVVQSRVIPNPKV